MAPREPTLDAQGMVTLDRHECLGMLHTVPVGRLIFEDGQGPIGLPVNHTIHRGDIVFRTAAGSKLDAAQGQTRVAFEADEFEADVESGWSVLVRGQLEVITDEDELDTLRGLPLRPWADEVDRDHWLRVTTDKVTGRRLIPADTASSD